MIKISPVKVENKRVVKVRFNSTELLYFCNYATLYLKTNDGLIYIKFWDFGSLENDVVVKKLECKKSIKIEVYKHGEKTDEFVIPIGSELEILKCYLWVGYIPSITIKSNKSNS